MKPYYADDWLTIYAGDCRTVLATLPADSVDCVVTSPPYWGLRDYGHADQLGLERTPEEYVANMVAVFAEVRRVLKPSGTCWLNLGDSYATGGGSVGRAPGGGDQGERFIRAGMIGTQPNRMKLPGLKPKDLVGIPWRVAFALQADGWYLRSDIIWSKPNPMPESVTDRPTKSHEYVLLLTKSARYYWDREAASGPVTDNTISRLSQPTLDIQAGSSRVPGKSNGPMKAVGRLTGGAYSPPGQPHGNARSPHMVATSRNDGDRWRVTDGGVAERGKRNARSVWTIATRPYADAHFAVFPPELPERCIKAGSSEKGVCPECGAPWERIIERSKMVFRPTKRQRHQRGVGLRTALHGTMLEPPCSTTLGWQPACAHAGEPVPAVILDPFGGSGTTAMVAQKIGRRAILIDLNLDYIKQQLQRNAQMPLGLGAA